MEDKELVSRIKTGDKTAFDQMYDKYHLPLYRNAYLITGRQQDAEDVLQETFVTAFFHMKELKNADSLKSWLFRIMTRQAFKNCKKNAKEIPDETVLEQRDMRALADHEEYDHAERVARRSEMQKLLSEIDLKHREVIVLYYYEEMTVPEIAKTLGCFEGTVKSRLHAARDLMKEAFANTDTDFFVQSTEVARHA